jgi:hypothetical protein
MDGLGTQIDHVQTFTLCYSVETSKRPEEVAVFIPVFPMMS